MNGASITFAGNLVDDPDLQFTPTGLAVAKFRVAVTERKKGEDGKWADGDSSFLSCQVWRQAAENCAESLSKGQRVIVQGIIKQRSYETKEGEKRTVFNVDVDEVGPSLRYATANVVKATRSSGGAPQQSAEADPWAAPPPAGDPPW